MRRGTAYVRYCASKTRRSTTSVLTLKCQSVEFGRELSCAKRLPQAMRAEGGTPPQPDCTNARRRCQEATRVGIRQGRYADPKMCQLMHQRENLGGLRVCPIHESDGGEFVDEENPRNSVGFSLRCVLLPTTPFTITEDSDRLGAIDQ